MVAKTKRQMTMTTAEIADVYANWNRSETMISLNLTTTAQRERRIKNLMHDDFGGYTRAEAETIIDNPDGFGDVIKARRLSETIVDGERCCLVHLDDDGAILEIIEDAGTLAEARERALDEPRWSNTVWVVRPVSWLHRSA